MSNRSVTYTLLLNSNVRQALVQTENAASSLDKQMDSLRNNIANIGLAIGAGRLIGLGKEWVEFAADYETAQMRIKNTSDTAYDGAKNLQFIRGEVDKFKIPLMEATESYGQFLAMIKSSGLAGDEVRKLHDEVLLISKVTAVPQYKMDAAIRDVGIMLGEGVLEARHLRALSYVMPQIVPYLAKQLGLDRQEFSKLISSGKLTKSAIDSKLILGAIEEYSKSLEGGLSESLKTTRSELNALNTAWGDFKQNIVLTLKPELVNLTNNLENGAKWLLINKTEVLGFAKAGLKIIEFIIAYRVGVLLLNTGLGLYRITQNIILGQTIRQTALTNSQTTAYARQTIAVNTMVAAIERLNFVQNAQNASFITSAAGVTAANTVGNRYIMSAETGASAAAIASGAAASRMTFGQMLSSAVLKVGLVWIAGEVVEALGGFGKKSGGNVSFFDSLGLSDWSNSNEAVFLNKIGILHRLAFPGLPNENLENRRKENDNQKLLYGYLNLQFDASGKLIDAAKLYGEGASKAIETAKMLGIYSVSNADVSTRNNPQYYDPRQEELFKKYGIDTNSASKKLKIPKDLKDGHEHIRGNSITNITIKMGDLIGMKNPTFSVKNMKDMSDIEEQVGVAMTKILTQVVNDSQLVGDKK
jgi:tape measure domain-containing protein